MARVWRRVSDTSHRSACERKWERIALFVSYGKGSRGNQAREQVAHGRESSGISVSGSVDRRGGPPRNCGRHRRKVPPMQGPPVATSRSPRNATDGRCFDDCALPTPHLHTTVAASLTWRPVARKARRPYPPPRRATLLMRPLR